MNARTHWLKWLALLLLVLQAPFTQIACGYVAAGAAGAVVGHEAAENDEDDDEDDDD